MYKLRTKLLPGTMNTNYESRAGKKRLYLLRRRVTDIAWELLLVLFDDREAPQHGAKAGLLILLFQRSTVETPTFCRRHGGTLFELLFLCAICGTAFAYPFFFFALHFFDFVSRSYFERGLFYWQALGLLCLCVFMDIDMCCLGPLPPIFRNEEDLLLFFFF